MSALQLKYFGKRKARHSVRRKVVMARRKSYRSYGRRARSYARSGIGGMKGMILPIGAGIAEQYLNDIIPLNGVGATAVGMFGHNETLKTIGLYQIGMSLGAIIPLPKLGGNTGGFQ